MLKHCDVIFQSYIYVQPFYLLIFLRQLHLFRKRKIIGISHTALRSRNNILLNYIFRIIYNSFDKILFHSQLNMQESIERKLVKPEKCEFLLWGDDLNYIDKHVKKTQGKNFLSTGREDRDFQTLISAFSQKPLAPLTIYTNKINYDNNYDYLEKIQNKYSNINIEFVEKSSSTTQYLAEKAGECFCVVIPLCSEKLYYCLGLTSVVEAMAMSKPIISTRNPYSPVDIEKEGIGFFVDDEESWIKAIDYLYLHPQEAKIMGEKGRQIAEEKFNIRNCAKQIDRIINE